MKAFKLCGPDPKPMTRGEATALSQVMKMLPPDPVVIQIGAYIGASTVAMLETRPDSLILSVDIKPWLQERVNVMEAGLDTQRVIRLLGDSGDVGTHFPWSCDFLYIDGDHRPEQVTLDTQVWIPKVRPGGYVGFHDYIPNPPPGIKGRVARVVDSMISYGGREFEEVMLVERLKVFRV